MVLIVDKLSQTAHSQPIENPILLLIRLGLNPRSAMSVAPRLAVGKLVERITCWL